MKKRLAVVVALSLVFACAAAQAAGDVCDNCSGSYENGFCVSCGQYQPAKSSNKVFQISNAGNLFWFMKNVNGGWTNTRNAVLTANIVFNPGTFDAEGSYTPSGTESVREWQRGIGTKDNPYKGIFDGNGKNISGLYLSDPNNSFSALFGVLGEDGQVKNVHVRNSYFLSKSESGGIVGRNEGTVSSCSFDGFVEVIDGRYFAGGIVGRNYGKVEKCWNLGSVKGGAGATAIGGIVGQNEAAGEIENCYNAGVVTGSKETGGIAGTNASTAQVKNCHSAGNVGATGGSVGALVGKLDSGSSIQNSYYLKKGSTNHAIGYEVTGSTKERVAGYSDERFASGAIAYLLNGSKSTGDLVWYQTIGTDSYPVFNGATVYFQADGNPEYTNVLKYLLTVSNGSGGGSYAEGASVSIAANPAEEGMQFDKWTGTDGLAFTQGSANDASAVFTMPAKSLNIAAVYQPIERTYPIQCADAEHGRVEASAASAVAGDTITLTLSPDEGYALDTLTVIHLADQTPVSLTPADGSYTFTMPAGAVSVSATFVAKAGNAPSAAGGMDVPKTGDSTHLALYAVLMCASFGGMLLFGRRRARS